ncbi:MAG TPA: serine hydrolase domain-containing protein [Rudaea sp.]|jgi:beta-lactamase class C|nr:serine hydrolase domain-containing protein [Rudaea sp.]
MFHLRTPAVLALLTLVVHAATADARDVREKWIHRSAEQGVHVSANPKAVAKDFAGWMDQIEQSGQISGMAAAIVKDDTVLLQRGIGYADAARGEHVSVDSPFRLASLSKAFASALAAMLVDEGMLNWDTRVAGVLPTFELKNIEASDKLTVRDILSQRVGLPHNTYDRLLEKDEPYEELVEKLRDVPMTCDVGECYGYQNITFALIGDITYAVSGDFFYHQVEKRIFHPLGMDDATYGRVALEASKDWARPHSRRGHAWVPIPIKEAYYHVPAAAGVNASIKDMTQWLIAQMGERPDVLPEKLLTTVHTPLVETPSERHATPWRRARLDDAQYALGWRVYDYAGQTLIYHAGAVQGYRSMIAFFPKYRFGAVMLWNCECALPSGLMPMLLDRYLGLHQVDWAGLESLQPARHALTASNRR